MALLRCAVVFMFLFVFNFIAFAEPIQVLVKELEHCPKGTSVKKWGRFERKKIESCIPVEGYPTRSVYYDEKGKIDFVVESGTPWGPIREAYRKHYDSLPANARQRLISPDDPHLVVDLTFKDGKAERLETGIGLKGTESELGKTRSVFIFDTKTGLELARDISFGKGDKDCLQSVFADGLVTESCVSLGEEYKDGSGKVQRISTDEDTCKGVPPGHELKRKVVYGNPKVEAIAYRDGQVVEMRSFEDSEKAFDTILRRGVSDDALKKNDIWSVLVECSGGHIASTGLGMEMEQNKILSDALTRFFAGAKATEKVEQDSGSKLDKTPPASKENKDVGEYPRPNRVVRPIE